MRPYRILADLDSRGWTVESDTPHKVVLVRGTERASAPSTAKPRQPSPSRGARCPVIAPWRIRP